MRNTTTNQTALGVVGRVSGVFADQDFRTEAFPEYKNDIKVEVTFMPFNKMSYNAYKRAAEKQNNIVAFQWDKENETQPQFIEISIADREGLVAELNSKYNTSTTKWIQHNPKSKLLTALYVYVDQDILNSLKGADAVFLSNTGYKEYTLEIYQNQKKVKSIPFSNLISFSYKTSHFCWEESLYGMYKLSGLRANHSNACKSYNKAVRYEKNKINY